MDARTGRSSSIEASGASGVSDDWISVIAVGVLAATLAAVCHETLGHGLGCLAVGGRITLLTSIYFRCLGATALTDAAGPFGNFLGGIAALALLALRPFGRTARLFLILFGALNLLWLFAQMTYCAVLGKDDWGFVALQMGWPWVWRPILAAIGIAGYVLVVRQSTAALAESGSPTPQAIRLAYIAAVASAVIGGLMWAPLPIRSAIEGFLAVGLAPLGLLFAAARAGRAHGATAVHPPITRSWWWIAVGVTVFGVFLFTQGLGLGPLAKIGLPK